jgi:putative chitinase
MSFTFTREQLSSVIGNNPNLDGWYEALSNVLPEYEIDSPQRVAAFIAQCTHESGGFKRLKENLNYRWESLRRVFPKYFPTDELAQEYAHKQEQIANRVYGSRMGNGDESSGDGFRYCGRGLIQLTGRNNYTKFAESIGMAVEEVPSLLETFEGAVKSACWFWKTNNLNQYADSGDILTMTKRINGGTIGLEDRIKHYNHALEVFSS